MRTPFAEVVAGVAIGALLEVDTAQQSRNSGDWFSSWERIEVNLR